MVQLYYLPYRIHVRPEDDNLGDLIAVAFRLTAQRPEELSGSILWRLGGQLHTRDY